MRKLAARLVKRRTAPARDGRGTLVPQLEPRLPAELQSRFTGADVQAIVVVVLAPGACVPLVTLARPKRDLLSDSVTEERAQHRIRGPVPPVDQPADSNRAGDR